MSLEEPADQAITWVGFPLEFVRATDPVYLDQAQRDFQEYLYRTLAASQAHGGRYNPQGEFGALYTASDERTCWLEVAARYAREGVNGLPPSMGLIRIVVASGRYVDLMDDEVRAAWEADVRLLEAEIPNAAAVEHCWQLGRAVRAVADFLIAPSSRGPGTNVPLFPDRTSSSLRYSLQSAHLAEVPPEIVQQAREEW